MISSDNFENNDRPITPTQDDCCGNSCNPCIFDVHKKLLEDWESKKINKLKTIGKNCLSLTKYNRFIIKNIERASEDCIFIETECGTEDREEFLFMNPSQHVMIRLCSTSKPYTPIAWIQKSIKLLIKLYSNGLASECFKKLNIGDNIYIRGPYGEFNYQRNSFKNIVMLSIGSGIAAMYPLALSIVNDDLEDTKIHMISGFRSLLHVPLKDELRVLTDYWNFECSLCLSQESLANITGINVINSRLNDEVVHKSLSTVLPESSLILICGTPEFNKSIENLIKMKKFFNYHIFS